MLNVKKTYFFSFQSQKGVFKKRPLFVYLLLNLSFFANAKANQSPLYQVIERQGQQIHILEIDPKHYKIISVQAEPARETVSTLVKKYEAVAGINGGFFYIDRNGNARPAGALKIDAKWIGKARLSRGAIGWDNEAEKPLVDRILTKTHQESGNAIVETFPQVDKSAASQKQWQTFPYIVGGIPLLIKNGKAIGNYQSEKTSVSFLNDRHARTAVCIKPNHHWVFLVASHTKEKDRPFTSTAMEGLTIQELTQTLQTLGCQDALNLDGGGSSTLVINNKVVNHPAGDMDELLHFYHERPVLDAILVLPR